MPKFKVTKTLIKKAIITRIVEAKNETDAEAAVALSIKKENWKFDVKLKSNTIKI